VRRLGLCSPIESCPNCPIVETTYNPTSEQLRAADSKTSILEVSGLDPTPYNLQPIYLRPNLGKYKVHWLKSRLVHVPIPSLDPIYVLPDDIVYMPEIYNLDVDIFLTHNENQVIENLAIHVKSAEKLMGLQYPWGVAHHAGRKARSRLGQPEDTIRCGWVLSGPGES
jgi:hypothetical protein